MSKDWLFGRRAAGWYRSLAGFDLSFQPSRERSRIMALTALARAESECRLHERIRFLCRSSLLIIDEIGCLGVGATRWSSTSKGPATGYASTSTWSAKACARCSTSMPQLRGHS
jgi:hypothetical protein